MNKYRCPHCNHVGAIKIPPFERQRLRCVSCDCEWPLDERTELRERSSKKPSLEEITRQRTYQFGQGWRLAAMNDPSARRGIWYRFNREELEVRAGREGDDTYAMIRVSEVLDSASLSSLVHAFEIGAWMIEENKLATDRSNQKIVAGQSDGLISIDRQTLQKLLIAFFDVSLLRSTAEKPSETYEATDQIARLWYVLSAADKKLICDAIDNAVNYIRVESAEKSELWISLREFLSQPETSQ